MHTAVDILEITAQLLNVPTPQLLFYKNRNKNQNESLDFSLNIKKNMHQHYIHE